MKMIKPLMLIFLFAGLFGCNTNKDQTASNDSLTDTTDTSSLMTDKIIFVDPGVPDENSNVIDSMEAISLIDAFYEKENRQMIGRLRTSKNNQLTGFFIERKSLDSILKDTTVKSVLFYFAKGKSATANGRNYTLIYGGSTFLSISDVHHSAYFSTKAYDYVPPIGK